MLGLYNRSLFLKRLTWILEKTGSNCRVNSHNTFAQQLLIKWFALSLYWTLEFLNINIDKEQSPDSLMKNAKLLNNYLCE